MLGKLYRLGLYFSLSLMFLAGAALVLFSLSEVSQAQVGEVAPVVRFDYSTLPQPVVEDARSTALKLFGNEREPGYQHYLDQSLMMYSQAQDEDVVMLFNSGGWGTHLIEHSPSWLTISKGIKAELNDFGYRATWLDYRRSEDTWGGRLNEMEEMMQLYPTKAQYLAQRIDFLTRNLPQLRIIIAGESTGSIISDEVMEILGGNRQVYSIMTGQPFWHQSASKERELIINHNGIVPDSFSRGDLLTIVSSNLKAWFHHSLPEDEFAEAGNIFNIIKAPGHAYKWQQPGVYTAITQFLEDNFRVQ